MGIVVVVVHNTLVVDNRCILEVGTTVGSCYCIVVVAPLGGVDA